MYFLMPIITCFNGVVKGSTRVLWVIGEVTMFYILIASILRIFTVNHSICVLIKHDKFDNIIHVYFKEGCTIS